MKERPIIMTSDSVRAILEGKKTQTRRVININKDLTTDYHKYDCPYGQVGDVLLIKETHYRHGIWRKNGLTKTNRQKWRFYVNLYMYEDGRYITLPPFRYIDNPPNDIKPNSYRKRGWYKRSPIFMPHKYIRNRCEITNIRVERKSVITLKDAIAEGFRNVEEFQDKFDEINPRYKDVDIWLWVIDFKGIEEG